jgi:hypothetical protein
MAQRFVLRDLPGVAELEARLQCIERHPSKDWAPEADGLGESVDRISRSLFGITETETRLDGGADDATLGWELNFAFLYGEDHAATELIFDAMGWDILGQDDDWLLCLHSLSRQIVCVAKGLKGHLPGAEPDEASLARMANDWGASLAAQAERFRRGR